jgi:hypothetical protein
LKNAGHDANCSNRAKKGILTVPRPQAASKPKIWEFFAGKKSSDKIPTTLVTGCKKATGTSPN